MSILLLFTIVMTYGSNGNELNTLENKANHTLCNAYRSMSTTKLQEEVEKRSIQGNLPFAMGIELIKRWTQR